MFRGEFGHLIFRQVFVNLARFRGIVTASHISGPVDRKDVGGPYMVTSGARIFSPVAFAVLSRPLRRKSWVLNSTVFFYRSARGREALRRRDGTWFPHIGDNFSGTLKLAPPMAAHRSVYLVELLSESAPRGRRRAPTALSEWEIFVGGFRFDSFERMRPCGAPDLLTASCVTPRFGASCRIFFTSLEMPEAAGILTTPCPARSECHTPRQ